MLILRFRVRCVFPYDLAGVLLHVFGYAEIISV